MILIIITMMMMADILGFLQGAQNKNDAKFRCSSYRHMSDNPITKF